MASSPNSSAAARGGLTAGGSSTLGWGELTGGHSGSRGGLKGGSSSLGRGGMKGGSSVGKGGQGGLTWGSNGG